MFSQSHLSDRELRYVTGSLQPMIGALFAMIFAHDGHQEEDVRPSIRETKTGAMPSVIVRCIVDCRSFLAAGPNMRSLAEGPLTASNKQC